MLPLGMLTAAKKQPVLVEVKSGETFNGTLVNCDVWMNLHLSDVIKTTAEGQRFFAMSEVFVRGSNIKCIRLSEEILQTARDYNRKQRAQRRARQQSEGGGGNAAGSGGGRGASFDRKAGPGAARGGANRAAGRRSNDHARSGGDGHNGSGARRPRP